MLYGISIETQGVRHMTGRMIRSKKRALARLEKHEANDQAMLVDSTNHVVKVSHKLLKQHGLEGMFVQQGGN